MKHLLISTIGNRDIQFVRKNFNLLPESIRSNLQINSENGDMLVFSKRIEDNQSFYTRSRDLYEIYDDCSQYIQYPLIKNAIRHEGRPDKVVLIATDQKPNYHLDTVYFGEILQRQISNDLEIEVSTLFVSKVKDGKEISMLFQELIQTYKAEYRITIHTSGGLPNFRISAFMTSLFQENVNVVNYIGTEAKEASMFRDYERHTLRHIVKGMLRNWNYSAVLSLPNISNEVRSLCRFAIARLALDLEKARVLSNSILLSNPIPMEDDQVAIEKELIYSAYIKYHQREYGDFLFRLFTFHDNMLIPHVEKILVGKVEHDKSTNHQSWNSLLRAKRNVDILDYLKTAKVGNVPLNINMPNKETYYRILHFCKKYSQSRKLNNKQFKVMKLYNKLSQLADLRNKIAHNYAGINESMILESASVSEIKEITNIMDNYLDIQFDKVTPYRELNEMIINRI